MAGEFISERLFGVWLAAAKLPLPSFALPDDPIVLLNVCSKHISGWDMEVKACVGMRGNSHSCQRQRKMGKGGP